MHKKKWIKIAIAAVACLLVAARIIYVNIVYPSARTTYVKDKFDGSVYDIDINKITVYTREEFMRYLLENDIKTEAEFYGEYAKQCMTYNPDEEYYAVVIDTAITNDFGKDIESTPKFNLKTEGKLEAEIYNMYYTREFNVGGTAGVENLKAGQQKNILYVYVLENLDNSYILEYYELGLNQRMKLELEAGR